MRACGEGREEGDRDKENLFSFMRSNRVCTLPVMGDSVAQKLQFPADDESKILPALV